MNRKRKTGPRLYGTKQVAQILDIPEWRVKNFSEGGAYRLPPSQTVGTGRGSRRLYNATDIGRLALANELVNCGFTPEAVGEAVREVPESLLVDALFPHETDDSVGPPLLVYMNDQWKVREGGTFNEELETRLESFNGVSHGIFLVNVWSLLSDVHHKISKFRESI